MQWGALILRAEIIPTEPDPGNSGVGIKKLICWKIAYLPYEACSHVACMDPDGRASIESVHPVGCGS